MKELEACLSNIENGFTSLERHVDSVDVQTGYTDKIIGDLQCLEERIGDLCEDPEGSGSSEDDSEDVKAHDSCLT